MAFGSVVGRGDVAAEADVVLRAITGEFKSDIREAEEVYEQSIRSMSSDSIKLALSTDKVQRSIAQYGPTSRQAARAELERRRVIEQIDASTRRLERDTDAADRSIGRFGRGALAGSGLMGGLGRSVAFASTTFLGGAGLLYAIRSTMDAAKEAETVQARLATAVKNSGLSWEANRQQIEDTLQAQSRLSAFDDEELAGSLATLVVRTKDVNEALRLNGVAADVARGRNISLESATMLVLKATLGQAGALRRLGIDAKKGADASELLALIQQKYAGQAGRYAETAAGKQELFNKTLQDSEEIIGGALTPVVSDLAGNVAQYLDKLNQSGELQKKVNTAVDDGTRVLHGLRDGIDDVRTVLGPVVDGLGGLEKAAQLALIVGISLKARRAALSFGFIQSASAVTRDRIVADAAVEEAALGRVGTAGTRAAGKLRGLGGAAAALGLTVAGGQVGGQAGDALSTVGNYGLGGALLFGAPGALVGLGVGAGMAGINYGKSETKANQARWNALTYEQQQAVLRNLGDQAGAFLQSFELTAKRPPIPAGLKTYRAGPRLPSEKPGRKTYATPSTTPAAPTFDADLAKTAAGRRLQLGLLKAESNDTSSTASLADNVAANRAIANYYMAGLKTVKKGSKEYNDIYAEYVRYHQAELGAIDQINAEKERQRQARLDKQRKDQQREANARKKAQREAESAARDAANQLYSSPHALQNARQHVIDPVKAKKDARDKPATKADIDAAVALALQKQTEINRRYAPNFQVGGTGKLETHAYQQVHETRRQTAVIEEMARRTSFPASGYALASAEAAL